MESTVQTFANVVIVQVEGRIDHSTAPAFGSVLLPHVEGCAGDEKKLLVDLSKVNYMSSAGLRELVRAYKVAQRQGGDVRLANPPGRILSVLEIAGLEDIFRIFDSDAAALRSF
jgi:anti-anti-sigma factor